MPSAWTRAPPVFLHALEHETENEQYSAVGLRLFGYVAFGEGDGSERIYRVTDPEGREQIIAPLIKPLPPGTCEP